MSKWLATDCLPAATVPQCQPTVRCHLTLLICALTTHWLSSCVPSSSSLCSSSHCLHVSDINVVCIGRNENNFWTFCGSVSIAKSFRRCFIHSFPNEFKINSIFCSSQFYLPCNLMCFVDKLVGILYKLRTLNMICSTCVASSSFP